MALRNIGIVAHINAGKTTLSERILFETGKQRWVGDVDSGTATMDWMVEEQRRGISITAAVTTVQWRDHRINLIDTPGHVDFTAEVERCVRVLDSAVVLVDGVRGVESQTETVWQHIQERELPCLVFVNKLDRATADFEASVESVRDQLPCRPVVVTRPLRAGGAFLGVVDLVDGTVHAVGDARPELDAREVEFWREELVETIADVDQEVFEALVYGREVGAVELRAALRRATVRRDLVPVFGGSALHDFGVDLLLDGICEYLPDPVPLDGDPDQLAALLYKVHVDKDGCLGFVRVFAGELRNDSQVEVASTGAPLRITGLSRMHANEREEIPVVGQGDFAAVALPMPMRTGETFRTPGSDVVLSTVEFSEPVFTMSLEPRTSAGREELETRAMAMAFEDPTLRVRRDPDAGHLLVSGMGELHLEVFGSRLNRRLAEPARFGRPAVAKFETVRAEAEESGELVRRVGDADVAASAMVHVTPLPPDSGVQVVTDCAPGPAVDAALAEIRLRTETGMAAPWPARDLRVELRSVLARGPDEFALDLVREVTAMACRRAVTRAGRIVLEPIVEFVVAAPASSFSSVAADLRSRGAEITEVTPAFGVTRVHGAVRLARLLGYAGDLRSMTQGKGSLRFELSRFAPADEPT